MRRQDSLRIAIMGFRGIPASYGGFETFVEELAPRLVRKGHRVTVYGRSNIIHYKEKYYKGVRIVLLPTISHKYFDTVFHTGLCIAHSLFRGYDIILILNAANSIFAFLPRLSGKKVVVNVDGIERKRKKWSFIGRLWYFFGEIFSVIFPNRIISDARTIQDYYRTRYHKRSMFIPYGAYIRKRESTEVLDRYRIKPEDYFLYVSRLEPENNAHVVIDAFKGVVTDKKLLIVGGAPYAEKYIESLKKTSDERVVFTGFVFGQGYEELQSHAFCYIHATEVGGTHPALIEAMGFRNCIVANGTSENREVLGKNGLIYEINNVPDLRKKMQYVIDNPRIVDEFGMRAQQRIKDKYSWDSIVDEYERLFQDL